jgi:hypothetical protein
MLVGHRRAVEACGFSPDGRFVVSASQDQTLKLWNPVTRREVRSLEGHTGWVTSCDVSPDGSFVVSASDDRTLGVWDPNTGGQLRTLKGHVDGVSCCRVSPDGSVIVSASRDGTLKVWDSASGSELRTLTGHEAAVRSCDISPDGRYAASAGDDKSLRIWDLASGAQLASVPCAGALFCVATHPQLPVVACGGEAGSVYLIELEGIEYEPAIATAVDNGSGPSVRCPLCRTEIHLQPEQLGQVVACSRPSCAGRLRINTFVTLPWVPEPESRRGFFGRWRRVDGAGSTQGSGEAEFTDTQRLHLMRGVDNLGEKAVETLDRGHQSTALAMLNDAERVSRKIGYSDGLARALGTQAVILRAQGRLTEAMSRHWEEEWLFREIGDKPGLRISLAHQAFAWAAGGNLEQALVLHEDEERLSWEFADKQGVAVALYNQARVLGKLERRQEALARAERAGSLGREVNLSRQLVEAMDRLADSLR